MPFSAEEAVFGGKLLCQSVALPAMGGRSWPTPSFNSVLLQKLQPFVGTDTRMLAGLSSGFSSTALLTSTCKFLRMWPSFPYSEILRPHLLCGSAYGSRNLSRLKRRLPSPLPKLFRNMHRNPGYQAPGVYRSNSIAGRVREIVLEQEGF